MDDGIKRRMDEGTKGRRDEGNDLAVPGSWFLIAGWRLAVGGWLAGVSSVN